MATDNDRAVLNCMFTPLSPFGQVAAPDAEENEAPSESELMALEIRRDAMEAAEKGRLEHAIQTLTEALKRNPELPSLYNDRAQVFQFSGDTLGALDDLEQAIRLTNGTGKLAGKAFAQRGTIHQYQGKEADALDDFRLAAEQGDQFAKRQLVLLNPMAALCNKMLLEVSKKLAAGESIE